MQFSETAEAKSDDIDDLGSAETSILTIGGVERLSLDSSGPNRIEAATGVGAAFAASELNPSERNIATEILENLSQDEELKVRQAVCGQLLRCPFMPPKIARILAQDVESIAVPIVRCSTALTDADLVALVRDGNTLKQINVAQRDAVSRVVTHELVDTGKKTVVKTVLANEGADVSEESFGKIVDAFGELSSVQALLVGRPELPAPITQRLVTRVPDALAERLLERHQIAPQFIGDLLAQGQERDLCKLIGSGTSDRDVAFLAHSLGDVRTLTPTLVLRPLCAGHLPLFVALMASLAGISADNARPLIIDVGRSGFRALYRKCGLPDALYPAFRTALDFALEAGPPGNTGWSEAALAQVSRQLAQAYVDVSAGSLDAVLQQLALHLPEGKRTIDRWS